MSTLTTKPAPVQYEGFNEVLEIGVTYIIGLLGGWLLLALLPALRLWFHVDIPLAPDTPHLTLFGLLQVALGFPLYAYGAFHARRATEQFQYAEEAHPTRPLGLLSGGYFANARHPFAGFVMLEAFGFLFSLGSGYAFGIGIILLVVLALSAIAEEQQLYERYRGEYVAYSARVQPRFFVPAARMYLELLIILSIVGLMLS